MRVKAGEFSRTLLASKSRAQPKDIKERPMDADRALSPKASTGVAGLDSILDGGLARKRLHLLEGSPGTGKTTIALQFLIAGAEVGETGIYVSLAETEPELRAGARSHGWTLSKKIEV